MTRDVFGFFKVMGFSMLIVSTYQFPLIESTLSKYGYDNSLNENVTFSKQFQQYVEDQKINFSSFINHQSNAKNLASNSSFYEQFSKESIHDKIYNGATSAGLASKDSSVSAVGKPSLKTTEVLSEIGLESPNLNNVVVKVKTCTNDCTVLMIGDSVMGDVNFSIQRLIKKDLGTWKVFNGHKASSGLSKESYYDWPATAKKLVEQHKPDYVFVLMGTNDAQNITFNGKVLSFGSEVWVNEYSRRVSRVNQIIKDNNATGFWIGLPVTRSKGFNTRLQVIRDIQSKQSKDNYISVENIFGKNDHSEPLNMKLRAPDGVHLNAAGSDLVAKKLIVKLKGT